MDNKDLQIANSYLNGKDLKKTAKEVFPSVPKKKAEALVERRLQKPTTAKEFKDAAEQAGITLEYVIGKLHELFEKKKEVLKHHRVPLTDPITGNVVYEEKIINGEKKLVPKMTIALRRDNFGKEVPIKVVEEEIDERAVFQAIAFYKEVTLADTPKETNVNVGLQSKELNEINAIKDLLANNPDLARAMEKAIQQEIIDAQFEEI